MKLVVSTVICILFVLLPGISSVTEAAPVTSSAPGDSNEYIYEPPETANEFTVDPESWRRINDPVSANTAIYNAIMSMTPEQRSSGDALDTAALFIETATRAGAGKAMTGDVSLSVAVLSELANTAKGILAGADNVLAHENVNLLRYLRTNVSIKTDEGKALVVSFPDDISGVAFDNVTVGAEFVSVTLNRNGIRSGGRIEVRRGESIEYREEPVDDGESPEPETGGQSPGDVNSRVNVSGGGFWSSFNPIDFWSLGVIALILIVWKVLAAYKHRFRTWVVPTFCALAIGINACTYFLPGNNEKDQAADRPASSVAGGNTQVSSGNPGQADGADMAGAAAVVEIIMSEGVRATISLPAVGGEKESLVLLNEEGIPQYSKYNPVTDMIDTRIRESGVYTLKEYTVDFVDTEQKNALVKEVISQLASRGIMTGTTDGFFFPDKPITRAELVSVIVRAFDLLDPDAVSGFADLNRNDWYYTAVATAEREGLIIGYEDNTFRGELDIPKEQLVTITANTLIERMGYIVPDEIGELLSVFPDHGEIAEWSEGRIALATQSNILIYRTDSLFAPHSIMTRGDAAIILYRVFSKVW